LTLLLLCCSLRTSTLHLRDLHPFPTRRSSDLGLIAVAAGAGGHAGPKSPFALIQEIREWFDGPLALAGSIAKGDSILAIEPARRSEEHTSELQSRFDLVCRLLLEKKNNNIKYI